MAKSIDGLSKLLAIYCGVMAMRDCWDGIDDETRTVIRGNEDLTRMMEIAEGVSRHREDWDPDAATIQLMGSLEKELNEMLRASRTDDKGVLS